MSASENCSHNNDPLKLKRDGTHQEGRLSAALNPTYVPVNERTPAHGMLFARAFAAYLRYFEEDNTSNSDWTPFFDHDLSVRLAVAAVQKIEDYKSQIKSNLEYLNNLDNQTREANLVANLSYIFSSISTLAWQLEVLKEGLPDKEEAPEWLTLRTNLQNLIQSQLAPALQKLIAYHKAGITLSVIANTAPTGELKILGESASPFEVNIANKFSKDWITDGSADWNSFLTTISPDDSVYGNPSGSVFELTNHLATHNLFTAQLDQFLKVYARIITDTQAALEASFAQWDRHDPHYALFLGFLRLFEYARKEANTLTGRHLDFYYRDILGLKEKPAVPANAHLIAELAKQAISHQFKIGDLFIAGKDALGKEVFFANSGDLVANQAKVISLKTLYRHGNEQVGTGANAAKQSGRLYASPISNSTDGKGKAIETDDKSWHPFFNKIYRDGELESIEMPEAETGFALASHYLWMAEGERTITLDLSLSGDVSGLTTDLKDDIICQITTEKGWLEIQATKFGPVSGGVMQLTAGLSGADPAVAPYLAKTHAYTFDTSLPVLMIKLKHRPDHVFKYSLFQDVEIQQIDLTVGVTGLKTLTVSNDFGPVDTAKPFQPFGARPVAGSSLIIGSKEVFQKNLTSATVKAGWLATPDPYGTTPNVNIDFLKSGTWKPSGITAASVTASTFGLTQNLLYPVNDRADLNENDAFTTESRQGFLRMKLDTDFGQNTYQADLLKYIRKDSGAADPGAPPAGPVMNALTLDYTASQQIILNSGDAAAFAMRKAGFYHVNPFGHAEQHAVLSTSNKVFLMPQFDFERDAAKQESEAEFYIGLSGLKPPQNLSLLFQISDGTANPQALKPDPHLNWSFLANNEWLAFEENEIEDNTNGLLKSGLVSLSFPSKAGSSNTMLPSGQHWIRVAVADGADTACRILAVEAQAMLTTFTDKGNDAAFNAHVLPAGSIKKMVQPDAAVKKVTQPFDSFGGHAAEESTDFYTRISERLRHKDRAITLWDYERLVLEAFPEIYRVKCLNHTQYEPTADSEGIYRELAPGHVTLITVPDKQFHNERDPLKPFTSLGTLEEIYTFVKARTSCFVKLHVRNPQFEEVRVNFKLRLFDGFDETFYTNLLRESITRFLSPWAFPGGESPTFGGKIYKSVLIDFVEEQPYVDYVTDFELFHHIDNVPGTKDLNEIEGSRAVSILVSVPESKHGITPIHPSAEEIAAEKCNCES